MASVAENMKHAAERQAFSVAIDRFLNHLDKQDEAQRGEIYVKLVNMAEKFWGKGNEETMNKVRAAVSDPNNRWVKYINKIIDETNPQFAKKFILNLGYEAFFRGTKMIRANREKYKCNIPWLILFDPTMACNMHCVGCWSGTYGHKNNMSYEDMDKIVREGKELGTYLYMMTGGEPLVRKKDIVLKPEEVVRQLFIDRLNNEYG